MVPVLRLGSTGVQELTKNRCVCVRKRPQAASASVRKHSRVSRIPGSRNGRETQTCHHLWPSRCKSVNGHTDRGGHGRETQNCRHFWTCLNCRRVSTVTTVTGIGGSWSRKAELSSLLDLPLVLTSQKCQPSHGSGRPGRETQNLSFLNVLLVVASQTCQRSHGSGGYWSRNAELSHLDLPLERRREEREERREERRKERDKTREGGEERAERRGEREDERGEKR